MIGLSNIRGNIQNKLKDISWSGNKPTVAIDLQCTILEKNTFYLIDSNYKGNYGPEIPTKKGAI